MYKCNVVDMQRTWYDRHKRLPITSLYHQCAVRTDCKYKSFLEVQTIWFLTVPFFKILGASLRNLAIVVEMLLMTKSLTGINAYCIFDQHEWYSWVVMFMVLLWLLAAIAWSELMLNLEYCYIVMVNKEQLFV